ncbi:MAG: hypothetical protein V1701_10245 [Planctomycetota bacterium]
MANLNRLIGWVAIWVCGIGSLVLIASDTTMADNESKTLTCQGLIFDGNTLSPIPKAEIKITLQKLEGTKWKALEDTQLADEQGRYVFKDFPGDFLAQEYYLRFYINGGKEYFAINYDQKIPAEAAKELTKMTLDFGLIKTSDKWTIKAHAADVIDKTPLPNVPASIKIHQMDPNGKQSIVDTVKVETDDQGNYQIKITADYCPDVIRDDKKLHYFSVYVPNSIKINDKTYEFVEFGEVARTLDIPINKTITNTINFAEKIFKFSMLDAQRNGHMTGVLVDSAGEPLVQAPITIEFGQTKT